MNLPVNRRTLVTLIICLVVLALLALLDAWSGETLDLFVLYFLPIYVAAWHGGRRSGLLVAVLSALGWLSVDYLTVHPHSLLAESWDTAIRLVSFLAFTLALSRIRTGLDRERALNAHLTDALNQVKQLSGILPMCSFCRRIRDEQQQWVRLEKYIQDHTEAQVSHGLCPECYRKHYGQPDGT